MKTCKILLVAAMVFISLVSCKSSKIIDKPINFEKDRIDLTLEYMQDRYELKGKSPEIDPKMIVLHWTAISNLQDSFNAFKNAKLPQSRERFQELVS